MPTSYQQKVQRLLSLMTQHRLERIVIRRAPNLAWITGGRVHIPMMLDSAVVDVVITGDKVYAVTNKIEADRLATEELPEEMSVEVTDWWNVRPSAKPQGVKTGSDLPLPDEVDLGQEIEEARQQLTPEEVARYQDTAKKTVAALEEALPLATPSDTEMNIARNLAAALWSRGLEPVVMLVAGDRRRRLHRHPLPTDEPIGDIFYASVCARAKGLVASATRVVAFRPVPALERSAYDTLLEVEAAFLDNSKPGAVLGRIFTNAIAKYQGANSPLPPDEWTKHHQGGPSGYLARDWLVKPETTISIQVNQAFSWNPSGGGVKVEDTVVVMADGAHVLAESINWPTVTVSGRARPDILVI